MYKQITCPHCGSRQTQMVTDSMSEVRCSACAKMISVKQEAKKEEKREEKREEKKAEEKKEEKKESSKKSKRKKRR